LFFFVSEAIHAKKISKSNGVSGLGVDRRRMIKEGIRPKDSLSFGFERGSHESPSVCLVE